MTMMTPCQASLQLLVVCLDQENDDDDNDDDNVDNNDVDNDDVDDHIVDDHVDDNDDIADHACQASLQLLVVCLDQEMMMMVVMLMAQ